MATLLATKTRLGSLMQTRTPPGSSPQATTSAPPSIAVSRFLIRWRPHVSPVRMDSSCARACLRRTARQTGKPARDHERQNVLGVSLPLRHSLWIDADLRPRPSASVEKSWRILVRVRNRWRALLIRTHGALHLASCLPPGGMAGQVWPPLSNSGPPLWRPRTVNPSEFLRRFESHTCHRVLSESA